MKRNKIQWKTISVKEVMNMMNGIEDKKGIRQQLKNSFAMNLKKYSHLKEAFEYYNQLPSSPTGLKLGTRRGGGWKKS